jgi:peptidoglycan-associated lipoprotein
VYFAGDLPGTKGGKDIWYMTYDARENVWGEPVNLESVNTEEDELFPHIRSNGDLYFASKGHPGMGGLDIFVAPSIGKNKFGEVQNLKAPINSPSNDFGIFFTKDDEEEGFFTSNRSGGKGGDDIYAFKAPPVIFVLQGTVRDVDCGDPIPNAAVKLIGTDGSTAETQTDASGQYKFEAKEDGSRFINKNTSYTVIVSKSSDQRRISPNCDENNIPQRAYLRGKAQETTVGIQKSTAFVKDFDLQCSNCGEIKFAKVLYPLAKWNLLINDQVNSADSLNDLYNTLVENPTIVIELQAHTDARGSDKSNQELSEKRARTCVEYLVEKGIDKDRLVPKGMGENEPFHAPDGTVYTEQYINSLPTKEEREAAHQINRRTVFQVLRDDFVPKEENTGEEGGGDEPQEPESGDQ